MLLRPMQNQDVNVKRRALGYILLAATLPLLFILACVVVEAAVHDSIQYGHSETCTIDNRVAKIAVYLVPTVAVDIVAVVALLVALFNLYRTQSNNERSGDTYNYAWIAFKVASMLGLTEIIKVVQVPNPTSDQHEIVNTISAFVYVFLRCSRGLFIAGFVFLYKSNRDSFSSFLNRCCHRETTNHADSRARSKTSETNA